MAATAQPSLKSQMEHWARAWNKAHPIGTRVRYWPLLRAGGHGSVGVTTSTAQWLGGVAGVYVAGAGFIAWTHVEAIA